MGIGRLALSVLMTATQAECLLWAAATELKNFRRQDHEMAE
jgi:hypothetical protein